jgi:hypothetical protein
VTKIRGFCR